MSFEQIKKNFFFFFEFIATRSFRICTSMRERAWKSSRTVWDLDCSINIIIIDCWRSIFPRIYFLACLQSDDCSDDDFSGFIYSGTSNKKKKNIYEQREILSSEKPHFLPEFSKNKILLIVCLSEADKFCRVSRFHVFR